MDQQEKSPIWDQKTLVSLGQKVFTELCGLQDAEWVLIPTCPGSGAWQHMFLKFLMLNELLLENFNRLWQADSFTFPGTSLHLIMSFFLYVILSVSMRDGRQTLPELLQVLQKEGAEWSFYIEVQLYYDSILIVSKLHTFSPG